jgi:hypothetical protein
MLQLIIALIGSNFLCPIQALTKTVVPALYKEWVHHKPHWFTDTTLQKEYGFTTFLYQKLDPHSPNYMSTNRGCESGPYFRYIVDHYDNFPDVAIFIHAKPEEHQIAWLDLVRCISPNATYMSLNLDKMICRSSWNGLWARYGIWIEQCIRNVLQIVHGYQNVAELNEHYPPNKPINMCLHCCQQFIMRYDSQLNLYLSS